MSTTNPNPSAQYGTLALPSLPPGPTASAKAITVADTGTDAAGPFRALWVASAGNIKITTLEGTVIVIPSVPAGIVLPIACVLIWSTGTTVATPNTNIVGLI